jgi:hypothetical protein
VNDIGNSRSVGQDKDALSELKLRVAELEYIDDAQFDWDLAQIDLIIYRLRTQCFSPPPKEPAVHLRDVLAGLFKPPPTIKKRQL